MKLTPNFNYARLAEGRCRGKTPEEACFFPAIYKGITSARLLKDPATVRAVRLCASCSCREACFQLGSTFGGPGIYGGWHFPNPVLRYGQRASHPINLLEAINRV